MSQRPFQGSFRLRHVAIVDFRYSEQTLFQNFVKENKGLASRLRDNDVIMFVNRHWTNLYFVYGFTDVEQQTRPGHYTQILTSAKLRATHGALSPLMLKDYGRQMGLEFIGLKSFAEQYEHEREKQLKAKRSKKEHIFYEEAA